MAFPKIDKPILTIKNPADQKDRRFRPFTVKEEKLLMIAKASDELSDILLAIKQVVANCSLDDLDVETLPIFALEYFYLKLRAASVSNVISVTYEDAEDEKQYSFKINLDEVKVEAPGDKAGSNKIVLGPDVGIVLQYPPASIYGDKEFTQLSEEAMLFELVKKCIVSAWQGDAVFETKNETEEELTTFVESLDIEAFNKIQAFLQATPKMHYVLKYKNSLDHERTITLSSLSDFFALR